MTTQKRFKFFKNDEGSLSVEAVFMAPLLVWALGAMFVSWDAFKTMNISKKATYTVADALSRERNPITPEYLLAMHQTYDYLMNRSESHALRVTVLTTIADPDTGEERVELVWSEGIGGVNGYETIAPIKARVPEFAPGDQMIIVESEQGWTPGFNVGIGEFRLRDVAISRPRFTAKLDWDDGAGDEVSG
jgi:hypothetical protein